MPCKIEIKQNLTNKVSADTDSGFNLSIDGANAIAKKVNQSYGVPVVSFSLNGDFIDRDISIPDSLVNIYYNNEINLENNKKGPGDQLTMFQTDEMPASKASEETVSKIKELAKQAGISIQDLVEYAKVNPDVNTKNANGLADIIKGIIAISQGRESEALTEEYVHIATAIIEQTNPQLITALISKIDRFKIYKQTLEAYKNKKDYQLPNGKPNIRKIKKEAVDKLITELIINQSEGSTEFPELMQEETRSMIREWWDAILDRIKQIYTKTNVELFETIAQQVVSGELGGTVADITTDEGVFLQIDPNPIIDAAYGLQKSINDRMILVPATADKKRHYTLDGKDVGMSVTEKHQSGKKFKAKTALEEARNAVKLKFGIDGHNFLENFIKNNLIDKDGYAKAVPTNEPVETPLSSTVQEALTIFAKELIASYKPGTRFLIENKVINEKEKGMLGSTIDFKAFEPVEINGKPDMRVDTLDWKFTAVDEQDKEDIAWWNIKSWPKQMGEYIKMDRNHGITTEQTRKSRMIPFIASWKYNVAGNATSGIKLKQLEVGNIDPKKETKLYLVPVPLETETTGSKKVDTLVKSLRNYYDKLYPGSFGKSVEDKKDFLNQLSKAIRQLQVQINFEPIAIIGKQFLNNSARVLNTFEEMDYNVLSEEDINKRLGELLQLKDSALKFKTIDDVFKSVYDINELDAKNKVTLNILTKVSGRTEEMLAKIARIEADYIVQLALKSKVTTEETKENILKPEVEISGLAKTFLEGTKLANRVINLASNLILKAKSLASITVGKAIDEFKPLILELEKEASRMGKTAFQMIGEEKNGRLRLIKKLNKEYYTKRDKAIEEQDKQFFLNNMDVVKFRELAAEKIKSRTEFIEDSVQSTDEEQNKIEIQKKIKALRDSLNIDSEEFDGYDSFYFKEIFTKSLKEENFYSEDFKNMKKSDAAFKVWSMFTAWNKKAYEMGYLDEEGMAFFPLMEATLIQKFANTKDIVGEGKDFFDDFYKARVEEEVKFSKLDPETGKIRKVIPKYYTRTDKAVSQLSTDLTKVSALYIKALINYETSKKIENTLMVLHSVEQSKGTIMTDEGGIVYDGAEPSVDLENNKSADILMTIINDAVYGISESLDSLGNTIISSAASSTTKTEEGKAQREVNIKKALDTSNIFIRSLAVGLKPLLAAANYMGFNFQAYVNAGNLYRYDKDFIGDHGTIVANRLSLIEKALLDYISPLNEDIAELKIRSISKEQSYTKWLGTWSFSDAMMSTNSIPERALGLTNALSMLKNSIVVDGKIVNIRQYLKEKDREGKYKLSQTERKSLEKTFENRVTELKKSDKTLAKIAKIENNQLVVPGVNDEELAQLRVKIIENNRKLNGQMNRDDKAGFARDTIFKSFMMFKTWIPKQILTRAINLKKSNELNEWEFGRTRAFIEVWSHLGIKRITEINDIISGSEKGLAIMDEILKEKRDSYFRKTGQKLEITEEEFYDLMRQELSNQVKELKLLFGLMTLVLGVAAMQPPEDADELTKNHYKYLMKLTHKISDELSFYYNPVSFESMTKGSILPQLGLGTKIITLAKALAKEGYYTATGDEKMADKTYPLKYFFNLVPVGYQLQTDVLPLMFPEAAKDMGIRLTTQARQ